MNITTAHRCENVQREKKSGGFNNVSKFLIKRDRTKENQD
jgi:hypothetical protein